MFHLRHLIYALFLALSLIFVGTGEAQAAPPAGERFCERGLASTEDAAQRTEESLRQDASGNRALSGCIATPNDFLESYQRIVREHGISYALNSVADLPGFFRAMQEIQVGDRSIEYVTDCLVRTGRGYDVRPRCETRVLGHSERVFGFNGKVVFYTGCANPGDGEAPPIPVTASRTMEDGCIEARFPSMAPRTAIRFAYIGPEPLPGRCHQLILAGGPTFTSDYPEECPSSETRRLSDNRIVEIICVWDHHEQIYQARVQNVSGSFYARADGTNVLRLPPEALNGVVVICWEMPDGTLRYAALGARRPHYVRGVATMTEEHVRNAASATPIQSQPLR